MGCSKGLIEEIQMQLRSWELVQGKRRYLSFKLDVLSWQDILGGNRSVCRGELSNILGGNRSVCRGELSNMNADDVRVV